MGATGTVAVVPSGKVAFTVEAGSAVPEIFNVPSGLAVDVMTGASGAVVSVNVLVVTGDTFPAASVKAAVTAPEVCGVVEVTA